MSREKREKSLYSVFRFGVFHRGIANVYKALADSGNYRGQLMLESLQ